MGGVADAIVSLVGNERTVPHLLLAAADKHAGKVALTDGIRSLTYEQLPHAAAHCGKYLQAQGVQQGDRVMILTENRLDLLDILFACSWIGAQLVPINPAIPASQLHYFLDYIEPKLIVHEHGAAVKDVDTVANIIELPPVDLIKKTGPRQPLWHESRLPGENSSGTLFPTVETSPDSPLTILLTSGTTGISKGVVCPHGQFIAWGEAVSSMLGLTSEDIAYTCLPLFHTNALNAAFQCLITGATFKIGPRFSSSKFWQRQVESEATATFLLGAMVSMLLNTPDTPDDRSHQVKRILAPGTPVDAVVAFEKRFGSVLIEGHGMTETNAVLGTPFGERRLGYMGRVMNGFQAAVVDEHDCPVADGTPGELVLRSNIPCAFASGYWRLPEVTVASNRNQWFHTGDRVVQEDGWFKFLDRIKDVIRRRGENISAWEVERVLDSHELIERSAVVPVPSELGEDEVMAFVIVSGSQIPDPHEIRDWCRESLPAFALPRFIEFVDELPLTDNGKVRKQVLRDRGVGESTWDANDSTLLR